MKKKIDHVCHMQNQQGFTLLILAVLLAVAGIVFVGLKETNAGSIAKRYESTAIKLEVINKALKSYYVTTGRYPCPADRSLAQGSGGQYGLAQAACAGAYAVPSSTVKI